MVVVEQEEGNEARFRESLDVDPDLDMERALLFNIYMLHHTASYFIIPCHTKQNQPVLQQISSRHVGKLVQNLNLDIFKKHLHISH